MRKMRLEDVCRLLEYFLSFSTSKKIKKEVQEHLDYYEGLLDD